MLLPDTAVQVKTLDRGHSGVSKVIVNLNIPCDRNLKYTLLNSRCFRGTRWSEYIKPNKEFRPSKTT